MPGPRRVSVIVPTCDRPALLREALASIRALEGDDLQFEVIVADNGVAPQTRAIADAAGARYVVAPGPRNASVARNAAMRAATCEFIAFLDDDDAWLPSHLRSHLDHLDRHPEHEAVVGRVISADDLMRPVSQPWPVVPPTDSIDLLRRMLSGYFPQIGAVVARTRVRDAIGGFDEKLAGGEDLDWLLRLARQHQLGFTPTHSVLFRGRRRGTHDALQLSRAGYDRVVFMRHAIPSWRIWRSLGDVAHAYYGTLRHFYVYFTDAAVSRAVRGDLGGARRAVGGAFCVFPFRAAYHVVRNKRLGKAFWATFSASRRQRQRERQVTPFIAPAAVAVAERLAPYVVIFGL